ncbi:histidine triad nucleotide-binding protein [Sulfurimonas sp.]|jgi:histidine triad (HIT) family protein|uniref:histidine triad nucleotide-binding protein n=1 Tax=Sulfurimonas sp. TaxID=2022749 RepID=UPI0025D8440A|nr:histidine triad nucleotide-binding protein [Sulfurimonas sp.]MBT5934468.1 histidine triad nucleotide-binding protein [Sulfurimonas sp.]
MCLFCKIVNNEIPSNVILEDENFLAFHDINPKAPVHILAIPKVHVDSFDDVKPETMSGFTSFIQKVVKEVKIDKTGYRVITNIGDNGGQEVGHLHFHILGGAKLKWGHFSDADPMNNL